MSAANLYLKVQTADIHRAIEKESILRELLFPTLTLERYTEILNRLKTWYDAYEDFIWTHAANLAPPDFCCQQKRLYLSADCRQLPDFPILNTQIPSLNIKNKYQALGALYVLEGATLGGMVIAEALKKNLGEQTPMRFLTLYGQQTYLTWQKFILHLNQKLTLRLNMISAKDGALMCFSSQKRIMT